MTRENLFRASFESQFTTYSGWKRLYTTQCLAPSDLPGYVLAFGDTEYTVYDSSGRPTNGVQHVTLKLLFAHSELQLGAVLSMRSDIIALIESFFSGIYLTPAVSIGDTCRIDSLVIEKIEPPAFLRPDTRSAITIQASYYFTLF